MASEQNLLESYFDRLWPITRSLTGRGVVESLSILQEIVPFRYHEFTSGSRVHDWSVPPEWNVNEAYICDPKGNRVVDIANSNLHLVGYSEPFRGRLSRAELDQHLFSLPNQPTAIPYRTSYYRRTWGFCVSQEQRAQLNDEYYDVVVDTQLDDKGRLIVADSLLAGESSREILISTYICHPSLANNELSGPLLSAMLFRRLAARPKRKFTYRFVFCPETIGAVAYLSMFGHELKERLLAGYVVTCVGDAGQLTYKKSRQGTSIADAAAQRALELSDSPYSVLDFFADAGSDERQYCSPGYDLPVGSIMRTMYGRYPEYHTSLDDKSLMSFDAMVQTLDVYERAIDYLENAEIYSRVYPFGEPQLGKRNLYGSSGPVEKSVSAMMWFLNLADGRSDLDMMSRRSGIELNALKAAAESAFEADLVKLI